MRRGNCENAPATGSMNENANRDFYMRVVQGECQWVPREPLVLGGGERLVLGFPKRRARGGG